ncbi:MAG: ATP-dependent DNA helicase [Fimbriimonadales bacterium]|nr:ATP-dependent DNA helicase [Fimbriimonadales bacterium]
METGCRGLIARAFEALRERPGFVERPDQLQLALLIADCLESGSSGAFEAPTGLGKSLAALVPALARAAAAGGRTVVATYTNVLAEQYWKADLPLARSLLPEFDVPVAFLIGRQRYVCLQALRAADPTLAEAFARLADQGTESELRASGLRRPRELAELWRGVGVPPACEARRCPDYAACWFFCARERAKDAKVVVTNHSVLLMDALLRRHSDGAQSLLGDACSVVIDEAHDFAQAAASALEFELSPATLELVERCAEGLEDALAVAAMQSGEVSALEAAGERFRRRLERLREALRSLAGCSGILAANPRDILEHPSVSRTVSRELGAAAEDLAEETAAAIEEYAAETGRLLRSWRLRGEAENSVLDEAEEVADPYRMVLRETAAGCRSLFEPTGVSVSYVASEEDAVTLRSDPIDLAEPLRDLVWSRRAAVCLSATLALDGNFGFFRSQTGFEPDFEEILPSPFDFATQAALYLPPAGAIPDPSAARRSGGEEAYYAALAEELTRILRAVGGRTLALFHSRREMEAVYERMRVPPELPVLLQGRTGVSHVGERFRRDVAASLFALRSFWTGFDAPGETLSCVALVRVPFEVPVDPAQIARSAWLAAKGLDPFREHSLPLAKMLVRQGAGRLIRRSDDRGVIALLDPRVQTKRYGQEILENLPANLRVFRDIGEAAAHVGLAG